MTMAKKKAKKKSKTKSTGYLNGKAVALFIYGPPGVGKSSLAARFPKPVFVIDSQETGVEDLMEFGQIPKPVDVLEVDTYPGLLKTTNEIAAGKTGARTAVFDSVSGFESLCFQYHCQENYDNDWSKKGFLNYFQGPVGAAKTDWPKWIDALVKVRAAGINVVVIGHSKLGPYANPWGADYDRFTPDMDKRTWAITHKWAQCILFYCYHVELEEKGLKVKPEEGSNQRFIFTEWTPQGDAKNRFGLEPIIDAGNDSKEAYDNWKTAFKEARSKGK